MTDTIKKVGLTLAGLAALGFGGAQLANATGGGTTPAAQTSAQADANEPGGEQNDATENDANEKGEANDATEQGDHDGDHADASEAVTGAAKAKAEAAALAEVPGQVTDLSAENPADDQKDATDKPEAGDKADPAYESKIAYDVEVTKADGTIVDVHLDKAFAVLGTEAEGKEGAGE